MYVAFAKCANYIKRAKIFNLNSSKICPDPVFLIMAFSLILQLNRIKLSYRTSVLSKFEVVGLIYSFGAKCIILEQLELHPGS